VILGLASSFGWAQAASQDQAKITEACMKAGAGTTNHEAEPLSFRKQGVLLKN
jgi:hypothetical protein